jgi:hypothetical protein
LTQQNFRDILLTDATTEDGEVEVAKYFKVNKQFDELLDQWHQERKVVTVSNGTTSYCFLSN